MRGYKTRMAFKPGLRDTLRANAAADRYYAAAAGVDPQCQPDVKPKREIVNRSDANDLEAAVLREVGELLSRHPAIVFAVRQNGGMVQAANGAPVWFYRLIRQPQPVTLTDFWGFANLPQGARPFAFECKRRDWKLGNPTKREAEQHAFICLVRSMGGIGGFVTSAEEALALIPGSR